MSEDRETPVLKLRLVPKTEEARPAPKFRRWVVEAAEHLTRHVASGGVAAVVAAIVSEDGSIETMIATESDGQTMLVLELMKKEIVESYETTEVK